MRNGSTTKDRMVLSNQDPLHSGASLSEAPSGQIVCPFVSVNGICCTGHIVRIEAYMADLAWSLNDDGKWVFGHDEPRSHYHLFCSKKHTHAGYDGGHSDQLKRHLHDLPDPLRQIVWIQM